MKDRQLGQHKLLGGSRHPPRIVKCGSHAAVTVSGISLCSGENVQSAAQGRGNLRTRHNGQPGRGQLDGQRKAFHQLTNLDNGVVVGWAQRCAGADALGAFLEKLYGIICIVTVMMHLVRIITSFKLRVTIAQWGIVHTGQRQ